ncbi:hypothetical protein SAY87_022747 [Trapa incisa]|uniref:Uncharacterized protein n=1 Tax=Trapa incisa TaxID=236973 RepID=A0AAN7Q4N6_9MYRT|nr:hypothetical protein SAY87_022747 [Trapa incisa]
MKASLKFRDDQKPLIRAKIPLNVLGLPFQSGIMAGESKELTLNLGTFFESGPSVRVSYRPNDSWNPFSLVVKTGTGPFGSPISSSMSMSAEFNLLNRGNPTFTLHFRPNFGDFSVKKSQSSVVKPKKSIIAVEDASLEVVEAPSPLKANGSYMLDNTAFFGKKIASLTPGSPAVDISGVLSGMEVAARTVVPVQNRFAVNFRWGVRVPGNVGNAFKPTGGITFEKVPFLVMNKIGIEHIPEGFNSRKDPKALDRSSAKDRTFAGGSDVAEACFSVKRQLEILQAENGMLRKAIEDLRHEFSSRSFSTSPMSASSLGRYNEVERNVSRVPSGKADRWTSEKKHSDSGGVVGKSLEADMSDELKKALKGAGGA